jgi:hypothetical protein
VTGKENFDAQWNFIRINIDIDILANFEGINTIIYLSAAIRARKTSQAV